MGNEVSYARDELSIPPSDEEPRSLADFVGSERRRGSQQPSSLIVSNWERVPYRDSLKTRFAVSVLPGNVQHVRMGLAGDQL